MSLEIMEMDKKSEKLFDKIIVVRGGGDIATGCIHRLWSAGFKVIVTESDSPSAIRRTVSVCEAIYDGEAIVEGMKAQRAEGMDEAMDIIEKGFVPVLPDPKGDVVKAIRPYILIDATIMKKDTLPLKGLAPVTIGLGPGFTAGVDADYVIETMRGHNLGRIITSGCALPDTGIPGNIAGFGKERVLRSESCGIFNGLKNIGDEVEAGETVARVMADDGSVTCVKTLIPGLLRGLLRDGYRVSKGFKVADVDPRIDEKDNFTRISDKARCISGSVLEICIKECVK